MSGMLWEEECEERGGGGPPFERSDAPQRPDMAAAKRWDEKGRWSGRALAR